MKENCWGKIAEKFAISKLEAQRKRRRYLLVQAGIRSRRYQGSLPIWLQRYIIRRTTVSNFGGKSSQGPDIHESDEDLGGESFEFEGDSTVDG